LGDRLATMRRAVAELRALERAKVLALSRVYETAPVGGPPQPDYLNAAALVEYAASARCLLEDLLAIETRLGRVRTERWGPRAIDLDILWIDGVAIDEPDLVVPHARLTERAFALFPLFDVAPGAIDPRTGAPFAPPADTSAVRLTGLRLRVE
jgi:2-amino-4-hydroxy-6-hydroxymethyldihydropteridine diphosphokinase